MRLERFSPDQWPGTPRGNAEFLSEDEVGIVYDIIDTKPLRGIFPMNTLAGTTSKPVQFYQ